MVIPPLMRNPYNGYTNPDYKVDDPPHRKTMGVWTHCYIWSESPPRKGSWQTWRIIPLSNQLATMVIVSPQFLGLWDPFQMAVSWAYKWGLLTTYKMGWPSKHVLPAGNVASQHLCCMCQLGLGLWLQRWGFDKLTTDQRKKVWNNSTCFSY